MDQAKRIIDRFPSLAALAKALGHKHPTTVQGWLTSGTIPVRHHQAVYDAAKALGITLTADDFLVVEDLRRAPDREAVAGPLSE